MHRVQLVSLLQFLATDLKTFSIFSPDVEFCGYTVPHPADPKMHFRIQMRQGTAGDALKRGLEDLVKMCDHTIEVFDGEMLAYKTAHNLSC